MYNSIILCFIFFILTSCTGLTYKEDAGFVLPSVAGSLESLVMIDGKACKDMDGEVGICSKRLSRDRGLIIDLPPRSYAYNVNVVCSEQINFKESFDVPKKTEHRIVINSSLYGSAKHFICVGSVAPMDRAVVTHKFEIRVRLVDTDYIKRSNIAVHNFKGKKYLVIGQHAKYTQMYKDGKWKYYNEKLYFVVKDEELSNIKVISESESGRLNYFNI